MTGGNRNHQAEGQSKQPGGGAWYVDPYAVGAERWWDGTRWTREVRGAPVPVDAYSPRTRLTSSDGSRSTRKVRDAASGDQPSGVASSSRSLGPATEYRVRLSECAGETLRLVRRDRKPPATQFDLLSPGGRVGSLDLFPTGGLVEMACAEGTWFLRSRHRHGWQFVIESSNDQHVGWYSGRKWLAGGTIDLTDGTQVALARPLPGQWRLRDSELTRAVAYLRSSGASGGPRILAKIAAIPTAMEQFHLVLLIACAVVLLEKTLRVKTR